jgi:hypothetical protein
MYSSLCKLPYLQAGNGAGANGPFEVLLQYRGLAFQAGGDKDLEQHVTIPSEFAFNRLGVGYVLKSLFPFQ